MPIRDGEKFCAHFLGDTEEEANHILKSFDKDLTMISMRAATLSGADQLDLKQEGIIGLARARREYDEGRGAAFRTLAIYKIKDAMREWITKTGGMKSPQYLKDAANLLEHLRKTLSKGMQLSEFASYTDVWRAANSFEGNEAILEDVGRICKSIKNLADRSCTSPVELLEKAEISPSMVDLVSESNSAWIDPNDNVEEDMIDKLGAKSSVLEIRKILTPEEYDLICSKFIEGKTMRDLEKELGITAASVTIKIKNIIAKLDRHKERIFYGTRRKEVENKVGVDSEESG